MVFIKCFIILNKAKNKIFLTINNFIAKLSNKLYIIITVKTKILTIYKSNNKYENSITLRIRYIFYKKKNYKKIIVE